MRSIDLNRSAIDANETVKLAALQFAPGAPVAITYVSIIAINPTAALDPFGGPQDGES
jgi:hypothetical protein